MAASTVFEQVTHTRRVAVSVIDAFASELGIAGAFAAPLGDVALEITAQSGPDRRTFVPPLKLWILRNASGFVIIDGTYTQQGRDRRRLPLADGRYTLRVRGEYYQELADVPFDWSAEGPARVPVDGQGRPVNLGLLPAAAYPLPPVHADRSQRGPTILRGSVFSASGDPLAGARIEVIDLEFKSPWPFLHCITGGSGDWAIWLPDRGRFEAAPLAVPGPRDPPLRKKMTVRVQYPEPDGAQLDVTEEVVLGTEHSIRNTALRGQVLEARGTPVAGARIETSAGPETSVSRNDGRWFVYFGLNQPDVPRVTVTVTTPDGRRATDSSASLVHGAMVVVPAFHV